MRFPGWRITGTSSGQTPCPLSLTTPLSHSVTKINFLATKILFQMKILISYFEWQVMSAVQTMPFLTISAWVLFWRIQSCWSSIVKDFFPNVLQVETPRSAQSISSCPTSTLYFSVTRLMRHYMMVVRFPYSCLLLVMWYKLINVYCVWKKQNFRTLKSVRSRVWYNFGWLSGPQPLLRAVVHH